MTTSSESELDNYAIRVYLVDDNQNFLSAAVHFLKRQARVEVVGFASSVQRAFEQIKKLQPDIILLDLDMPEITGFVAIPLFQKIAPQSKIIILTLLESENDRALALAAGADDFISKSSILTELMPALFKVFPLSGKFASFETTLAETKSD